MNAKPSKPGPMQVAAYLLGSMDGAGRLLIEQYAAANVQFLAELEAKRAAMIATAQQERLSPPSRLKTSLFTRLEIQDDPVGRDFPPYIHSKTQVADFMPWIGEALKQLAASTEDFDCIPVGASADTITCLAKMSTSIPEEVHTVEIERVMLIEGHCDFVVGHEIHHFGPGDRYQIPLHVPHSAHNTSPKPCIFIVQRSIA